jgi:hypothetical protein
VKTADAPEVEGSTMLRDGTLVCDGCQKTISRITHAPPDGWPALRNLCSTCFAELRKQSIPRG